MSSTEQKFDLNTHPLFNDLSKYVRTLPNNTYVCINQKHTSSVYEIDRCSQCNQEEKQAIGRK